MVREHNSAKKRKFFRQLCSISGVLEKKNTTRNCEDINFTRQSRIKKFHKSSTNNGKPNNNTHFIIRRIKNKKQTKTKADAQV